MTQTTYDIAHPRVWRPSDDWPDDEAVAGERALAGLSDRPWPMPCTVTGRSPLTLRPDGREDTEDSVVRGSAVVRCRLPDQVHDDLGPVELGIDVGAGGDFSVIMARFGGRGQLLDASP
jgi:hypothetical protein